MMPDLLTASSVPASLSLADPAGSGVLLAAVAWLQNTVLGTAATAVAVIAVAFVGLAMLNGRLSVRHGVTVVLGCFILFGAPAIVAGIRSFVGGGDLAGGPNPPEPPLPAIAAPPPIAAPAGNDPYAGASVPTR